MEAFKELYIIIKNLLQTLGQTISVWDIIDVVIIAYLIYKILTVMRKTSAGSVMKGIVLIVAIASISLLFKMKVLSYILNQTLRMGIVVLVVLFQPELRKLFEQMGSRRLSFIFRKRVKLEEIETIIRSVVAACEAMSISNTGAIIVFEREIGLSDYAATGTRVDALVTSDLIQSIFYHNSPLHDGALLLREGRMLAASCMLPLSNNVNLSRDLGMRHRAAVGISERSDAVAIVISEQTGAISVAVDGMLKHRLTKETFETLLNIELTSSSDIKIVKNKARKFKVTQ